MFRFCINCTVLHPYQFSLYLCHIYLFLTVLSLPSCAWTFSSCNKKGLLSSCGAQVLGHSGFGRCGAKAPYLQLTGSTAWAQQLWHTGSVAPGHVGSSWTRDQTSVLCTAWRILSYWTIMEAPQPTFRIIIVFFSFLLLFA